MNYDLTDQEHNHVIQLLINRPLAESLPLYLKLTGQKLVPIDGRTQAQLTPVRIPNAEHKPEAG